MIIVIIYLLQSLELTVLFSFLFFFLSDKRHGPNRKNFKTPRCIHAV